MGEETLAFDDSPIYLENVDIDNILVSNKIFSGEKNCNYLMVTGVMIVKLRHFK